jgi:glycosyltransferase involved in cell wall biosynthesis
MTDPPLIGIPALLIAKLRGARCIHWLQDIFPEVAERLGVLRSRHLSFLLKGMRNWSLRHGDGSVVIGKSMAALLVSATAHPPYVIPNWALEERAAGDEYLDSSATHPLRVIWALENALVVGYSGNMGRAHQLNDLVGAAISLRNQRHLRFLLIGEGAQKAALEARVREAALTNVLFRPYQPRSRLRESLTLPDIHIVSLDAQLEGTIVPSKFAGVVAMGRPVIWIGSSLGEIGTMVREYECGIVVPPGDEIALSRTIAGLCEDFANGGARLKSMSANSSRLWNARFRRDQALGAWATVIRGQ